MTTPQTEHGATALQFEHLRPAQIVAERERCPLVFLPIGPLEWHSVHLPYGTDALNATGLARAVAGRVGGVVLPTFYWGTERERPPELTRALGFDEADYVVGMDFPKHSLRSLYCREEFLALLVRELLDQLLALRYQLIVIITGHGASNQIETLRRLSVEYTATSPARVLLALAWLTEDDTFTIGPGHADAAETSIMLAMHPELVDLQQLPPASEPLRNQDWGIVDAETFRCRPTADHTVRPEADPRLNASAERGQQFLGRIIDTIERDVRAALHDIGR
jgi:creatinine amidohydrolase